MGYPSEADRILAKIVDKRKPHGLYLGWHHISANVYSDGHVETHYTRMDFQTRRHVTTALSEQHILTFGTTRLAAVLVEAAIEHYVDMGGDPGLRF